MRCCFITSATSNPKGVFPCGQKHWQKNGMDMHRVPHGSGEAKILAINIERSSPSLTDSVGLEWLFRFTLPHIWEMCVFFAPPGAIAPCLSTPSAQG